MVLAMNPLSELTVLDEAGLGVKFSELWRERTSVLVFVRHFG